MHVVATFSIVARDPRNGDLGVAVHSKFLAVGAVVPWAQAGVGAIATQALANIRYGPDGLALLAQGLPADEVLAQLIQNDPQLEHRQIGIVDDQGRAAAFTGSQCLHWAGHVSGDGFTAQGNILEGPPVVSAMAEAFQSTAGELAERLVTALRAGEAAGGDRRGRQSAALYVARAGGSYGGNHDRYIDLRVDDHPQPIDELSRLLELHRFYLTPPAPATLVTIDESLARELRAILRDVGYYDGPIDGAFDEVTSAALQTYAGVENLEMRLTALDRNLIDPQTLEFLRRKQAEALAAGQRQNESS